MNTPMRPTILLIYLALLLLCTAVDGSCSMLATASDLQDKRIAVLQGSTHEAYAVRQFPRATVLQYKSVSDMLLALKSGKADAAIYSRDELMEYMRASDEFGFVGGPLYRTPLSIAFHQQDAGLLLSFNRFLQQIRTDGTYDGMLKRWMQQGAAEMPKLTAAGAGKPLMVGILSDNGLPFIVMKENRLIGFNIELMERFGIFCNRSIQYVDMEFGSQIAALAGHKLDLIATPLAVTEERKKRVAFSDPYYNVDSLAFALKKNIAGAGRSSSDTPSFFSGLAGSFQSNIIQERRYLLIWDGFKTTVIISVFATLFGTLLGALICFMRMAKSRLLSAPARLYIAILRGTPVLVLLMLIFYVVFASVNINPVIVAVIAFGMNFGAYTAEIFRTGIEGVEKGQTEAGISLGFTRTSTFFQIVLPQMVRRILPVYKGEFISLVKMTSIVGYIAVQDLTKASDIIRSRTFDAFFPLVMVAILYFLISWTLMQAMGWLEQKTDRRRVLR
ncbi:ABC transporter substrate-binding protein/permease [Trichlorobacter lovleyi]|uniref:ABC transporter substrate-binding protein/permease n=1 Tax=Trichlorobacter lovleyi TaxID=313985 RepID=UPI002240BE55|nr:ABC transporter substrate-binding protein/permease [Trichlorobacter lovleyi]QOX77976.1 ABC transporter substrate-binding protein/permease [Trichlorobacter lovleyi]